MAKSQPGGYRGYSRHLGAIHICTGSPHRLSVVVQRNISTAYNYLSINNAAAIFREDNENT